MGISFAEHADAPVQAALSIAGRAGAADRSTDFRALSGAAPFDDAFASLGRRVGLSRTG